MALPSSGPLSMSEIATEQQLSTPLSNVSLRSMSATAGFSTPDAISEFYGYSFVTLTSFLLSDIGYNVAQDACDAKDAGEVLYETYYHDGSGAYPVVNDTIYTDSGGNTLFDGSVDWYVVKEGGVVSDEVIEINTLGVVVDDFFCS